MVNVRFFGMARLNFNRREMQVDATSMKELIESIASETGLDPKDIKQYLIYVNEVNIDKLKRFRTRLEDGDQVLFLSPSSGG